MRQFFLAVAIPPTQRKSDDVAIPQTASAESGLAPAIPQTLSAESPGGENLPVGVILCSGKNEALVRYATEVLPTKLLVREYLTALPDENVLAADLEKTRMQLEERK